MPPIRRSFVEVFADFPPTNTKEGDRQFTEAMASTVYARVRAGQPAIDTWPQPVRFFHGCYHFMYQISNGGFAQAAYNSPELFSVIDKAYELFNCRRAKSLIEHAISLLPSEAAEHDAKELQVTRDLQAVFSHYDQSSMASLDSLIPDDEFWIDSELHTFARQHQAEFEVMDQMY